MVALAQAQAQAQAQLCPCSSSFIFFSQLKIPTNCVKAFISPRPRSLARRRLTAQATRRTGGGRRPWDSNAESVRGQRFDSSPLDDDEADEGNESGFSAILEEAIDSIWIFKVFKSFGWLLPVAVLSALLTTGAKAFLAALAVSVGLSAIPLVLGKLSGSGDSKRKRRRRRKRRAATASREQARRPESEGHRSSSVVVENGSSPSSVGDGEDGLSFGGWEELDPMEYERLSQKSSSSRRSTMEKEKRRVEVGTRRNEPLLLRLLIAVFPILGSWTKLFW